MRRITLAVMSTLAVLVLLFSYKTSRDEPVASAQVNSTAVAAGVVISSSGATTAAGSADPPDPASTAATQQNITVPSTAASAVPATTTSGTATSASIAAASTSTSTAAATTSAAATRASTPTTAASTTTSTAAASKAAASTTATTTAATSEVVDGGAAQTRYGPVQVQITVKNGEITAVTAIDYPQQDGRDAEINAQAIPELQAQALAAQSATIDGVSGATFTTQGFEQSLQSAIDAAHLSR